MPGSDWSESVVLAEWAEEECRHLDLIASWETLLNVYQVLGFDGPDNDEQRLSEFKSIITETNKFLTRMRTGLGHVHDIDSAVEFLAGHANTVDMSAIKSRHQIAFNKLKQSWIMSQISALRAMVQDAEEGERDDR